MNASRISGAKCSGRVRPSPLDVADIHDAIRRVDGRPSLAIRIAFAIPAFVVIERDLGAHPEIGRLACHPGSPRPLKRALKANPHVPERLIYNPPDPLKVLDIDSYQPGSEEEADLCAFLLDPGWQRDEEAILWLEEACELSP